MLGNPNGCSLALQVELSENLTRAIKALVLCGRKFEPHPVAALKAFGDKVDFVTQNFKAQMPFAQNNNRATSGAFKLDYLAWVP